MLLQPRPSQVARGTLPAVPLPAAIVLVSLALGGLSLLLPSSPTYDPMAWIIWGREITELDLLTTDGPSWKPLPVVLTTITAPLGEASAYIWVAVARAGAIAGVPLAYLLAARLAGPAGGVIAAVGLALMPWWIRNGGLGNSEGLMVALVLGAILAHLHGRRGWAFALVLGAGLLRPEAWPFAGLYALWLLWEDRARLRWVAAGLATLPVLWLGPELWGSGNAWRASDRAQQPNPNSPAFADDPAVKVLANFAGMLPEMALVGTGLLLGVVIARRAPTREARVTALLLALLAGAWLGLVALMTVRGFSGNQRYLVVPAALVIVLGAAGIVWAALAVAPRVARLPRLALAAAAVAVAVTFVAPDAELLEPNLEGVRYQAQLYDDLQRAIEEAGGAAVLRRCGRAYAGPFVVPQVAWRLHVHGTDVDLDPAPPAVIFHARHVPGAPIAPAMREARPNVLARQGHWAITADCQGGPR